MNGLFEALKQNLSFIMVCLIVVIAFILIARIFERLVGINNNARNKTYRIAFIGMFSAISGVLMCLEIPAVATMFIAPSFYRFDFSEIPVLICAFAYGPMAGVITEFIKILIKLILKSTSSAFVGELANFIIGCSMILPASLIYHIKKTRTTALVGMGIGTLVMTVIGAAFNGLYLLPAFAAMYGMPLDVIVGMGKEIHSSIDSVLSFAILIVAPFNLLKGIIISTITFVLYKRVSILIHGVEKNGLARVK